MRTEGMKIKCARCGLEGFVENKGEMMGIMLFIIPYHL